ncbi:pentapeptide repeat-containing protein [Mucilaginibacter rubeus]|uniref:Pentapeptide repeat-containing protein n=1 Tax=Mucilaginibacter rubeus TaxID=2027860 RepID=A0A5C1I1G0_9SPHI|nr:pentapeptide repeat-containing protein [Mucilaginibacter rubeus]QEM11825.1 pentapeptide repeat-containing protein [Mucilaginibacter rubeus]
MENAASNNNERITIKESQKILDVKCAMLNGSTLEQVMMNNASFKDVCITGLKIEDANLSDLEIKYAQLGGAYIHDIGMPPEGHPAYDPNAKQRPLKFENCDLQGSTITDCNLSNVSISDCNLSGMKINGIEVTDLLKAYQQK